MAPQPTPAQFTLAIGLMIVVFLVEVALAALCARFVGIW